MARIVAQFSCGAASAVAARLVLAEKPAELLIINARIVEEGEDNRRFAADCERWFQRPITVMQNDKFGASTYAVWKQKRYLKGLRGAPCSSELKRKVLDAVKRPDDVLVFGYTAEEQDRFEDFVERNPQLNCRAPLIEKGVGKSDCLAMVERAGIQLPQAYRDGFNNANCPDCPKGGEGHWNRVRKVYPLKFIRMQDLQAELGEGSYFFRDRKTGERFGLKDLDPSAGRHDEPAPACSFFCELAEQEYTA